MIRNAQQHDMPALIDLLRMFHQESQYRHLPANPDKIVSILYEHVYPKEGHCCFVAQRNDLVIGLLMGRLTQYSFSNALRAEDSAFFVHPDYRGTWLSVQLIKEFSKWGKKMNASEIVIGINSGINTERSVGFLKKLGFELRATIMSTSL